MSMIVPAVGSGLASSGGAPTVAGIPTVSADTPPPGLAAVTFNNTTNDQPALQALLDYVKATYGGGRVVLSKPNGAGVRLNAGITIPAKVQLVSDETTLINASPFTTGAAITVNDVDFTPLVGIRMDGGLFTPVTADLTNSYTGIKVTGRGLRIENIHLQYFGRGVDLATSGTFCNTIVGGHMSHVATGFYVDLEAAGNPVAGERNMIRDFTVANSRRGFNASNGGNHLRFENVSVDFTDEVGRINNAHVYYQGHIETTDPYIFDVAGNSMLQMSDTELVLGQAVLFKTGVGPSNPGFGGARFDNCVCFFTSATGVSGTIRSEHTVSWPANTTSLTLYVPYPLKWTPVSAQFVYLDGTTVPNNDVITIGASPSATGQLNMTAPTNAAARWARIKFG
jgi:hypothetical protein